MNKFSNFICKHRHLVIIISTILLIFSFIGMNLTKVNYDILVYLPENIETIKGQNILTDEFQMGSYSIAVTENLSSKDILNLENQIKNIDGVNKVASIYDIIGTSIPLEILPNECIDKVHKDNTDILLITFNESTSNENTLKAVNEIRQIANDKIKQGGMSSMVLDTMNLSQKEIFIYIVIAVIFCIIILELSLDSYIVPFILLANIGFAIIFNLGSNIFLGEISYITKALVAVLQLGVTTDFSIFLYHSYEKKKTELKNKEDAMKDAIKETFSSVTGSSLTTIAGFLVLCTMQLTLGKDLGIVMAKGVLLGVICVLTLFPSLLLAFDNLIEKTKHKKLTPNFDKLNKFIIKNHIIIFACFLLLLIPAYLAYSKVDVYYKLDKSLPNTLESISTNELLKDKYNLVSLEMILVDNDLKNDDITKMVQRIDQVEGINWSISLAKLASLGISKDIIPTELLKLIENENYQIILLNSNYETATNELNNQIDEINKIVKEYDNSAIVAGEGPLMKDLVTICDTDFKNVNVSSIVCIFLILFLVLKSFSLPFLLIIAIEFAIFMNMSFSYFGGIKLPFIAPIVLGTIQLGATIDYAILLTTTYLKKRRENKEKKEAMLETLNYNGTSILTSGMCFFAATFGVGIYSKIEMIGTLCSLIARGAIISMLVVITVLPSILLIFDKLIIKTTIKKKEKNNMKKQIKKLAVWTMLISIIISPISAKALTKEETVYSKLNYDGTVKSLIVNEQIINENKLATIEDYTTLENILNTNNDNSYKKENDKLIWNASGEDVFYQGTTNKKLPIDIKITYKLNGKEEKLDNIIGKSGKIEIVIKYENKDKHKVLINNKWEVLYTPFVVSLGTILDNEQNSNVSISNGKIVANGKKDVIASIAAPGLYESLGIKELKGLDKITIKFDTKKFELPCIYSVITPKLLDTDDLKIFDKMDKLYNEVNILQENMNTIDKGAQKLNEGSKLIKNSLKDALKNLENDNNNALSDEQLNTIKNNTIANVEKAFTDEYKEQLANKVWEEVKLELGNGSNEVKNYVVESVTKIMANYLGNDTLNYGKCLNNDLEACQKLASNGKDINTILNFQKVVTEQVTNTATKTSYYVAQNTAKNVTKNISEEIAKSVAQNVATTLAPTIANQVKKVSIDTIKNSLQVLYGGINELDNGIETLSYGINTFNQEGINKISYIVNNNLKITSNKIKELTKLSNSYDSFTTNNKLDNSNTKFIVIIDSKKAPENKDNIKIEETKVTFWDRVKNLFK